MSMPSLLSSRPRSGQTAVEYVLVVSVIVIGMWATAQFLESGFSSGLHAMTGDVTDMAGQGYVGG